MVKVCKLCKRATCQLNLGLRAGPVVKSIWKRCRRVKERALSFCEYDSYRRRSAFRKCISSWMAERSDRGINSFRGRCPAIQLRLGSQVWTEDAKRPPVNTSSATIHGEDSPIHWDRFACDECTIIFIWNGWCLYLVTAEDSYCITLLTRSLLPRWSHYFVRNSGWRQTVEALFSYLQPQAVKPDKSKRIWTVLFLFLASRQTPRWLRLWSVESQCDHEKHIDTDIACLVLLRDFRPITWSTDEPFRCNV